MQETKEEEKEETARLLLAQHTAFSEAYKVLQDHMEESVIIEEVLRNWPTHDGQFYQQTRNSGFGGQENDGGSTQTDHRGTDRAGDQQVATAGTSSSSVGTTGSSKPRKGRCHLPPDETTHLRSRRAEPSFRPQYGENAEVHISEKMSVLSSLTTLTIDIQKNLQSWTNFQHHLAITALAIVEVCIQKRPTIRMHSPQQ